MQLQQSPVFWKIFRDIDSTAPTPPFAGLEPIIYYIILCLIRALLLLLHMAIITCNTVFSENPLRAVGYFVYIHIRWRKLLIYHATRSIFLNAILFSVFVYRDVALLCYYIVRHAAHETCTYMCRKWVRFDETVTITSDRFGGEKRDDGYIQQSDWSDFILHFSCISTEPTRIPNDCKRSGLQLLLCIVHISLL